MYKLLLSLVLIISGGFIGNSFSQKLINRRKTLSSLVNAISRIKTLICFGGMEITEIVEKTLCTNEFPLINYQYLDADSNYDKAFETSVSNINARFALTKSDKELLLQFGSKLGDSDIQGQVAHTELYAELFSEKLSSVKEQEDSKTKLYRILGFSLGCAISLIIV